MSQTQTLTDDQQGTLEDMVHDTAAQTGSNAINAGESAEFLRALGYGQDAIAQIVDGDDPDEGVHDAASSEASDAINSGEGWDYLLSNGWTDAEIRERLGL